MWHDFKILLRELTTTIHLMRTTEATNAAKAANTLLQTTSTLLLRLQQLDTTIITLPGSGSTDHATIQGEQNKRQSERTPVTTILQRLSIPVAPVTKRRDNNTSTSCKTHQSVWLLANFTKSDLIWPKMALRARATIGILKDTRCGAQCDCKLHSKPVDVTKNVAHQDRMTPVENVYKTY